MEHKWEDILSTNAGEYRPGVCHCCLEKGMFLNDLNSLRYRGNEEQKKCYSEIIQLCFALIVPSVDLKEEECYICDLCIFRLRDAFSFKSQIEEAQKDFLKISQYNIKIEDETTDDESVVSDNWNTECLDEYKHIVDAKLSKKRKGSNDFHVNVKQFKSNDAWERELKTKVCMEKNQCLICLEYFTNGHLLSQHLNEHYPNYVCDVCGKAFASLRRIRKHANIHNEGSFKCDQCEKVFNTKSKWENHIATHRKSLRFRCPRCPERFADYVKRQRHLVTVHEVPEKQLKCKYCDATFKMTVHRSLHTRRVHLKEKTKKCTLCDRSFFGMKDLSKHMVVHTGERLFKCEFCKKKYTRTYSLKEHMKIHTNERRFICGRCKRSFTQKCTLKFHMRIHDKNPNNLKEFTKKDESGQNMVYIDLKEMSHRKEP